MASTSDEPTPADLPERVWHRWVHHTARVAAGVAVILLGVAVALGWPFESIFPEPSLAHGPWPFLGAWLALVGAAMAVITFITPLRRWPWRRPRRRLPQWIIGALTAVLLPIAATVTTVLATAVQTNVGELEFRNPVAIPELLEPTTDEQGRQVFDLTAQHGVSSFLPGATTDTYGVNQDYLGPTLRTERGAAVQMNVTNAIDESTTMHWHGMHLPAAADGGPHQIIAPGETWSPEWTVDQHAATLWYHPHPHGRTGDHVYRGMAGLIIIEDEESRSLDLPQEYGVDDIPLIVQDRQISRDGTLEQRPSYLSSLGVMGDEILVNGAHDPHLEVSHELVRFRILNGSNNRLFNFGFTDSRPFWHVATDGGFVPHPYQTEQIQLSPGERAEIVVEFAPGDDVILRSFPPDTGSFPERRVGGADTFDILRIIADDHLTAGEEVPDQLVADPDIGRFDHLISAPPPPDRVFELGEEVINGRSFDMRRIDEILPAGATEVWEVRNVDDDPHNFHPHDRHLRVISVDGAPPPPELAGWKDTVYVPPESTIHVAVQIGEYTDPTVPYMIHCHMLTHEDHGMMAQFTVVEPDQVPLAPRWIESLGDHDH